MYVLLSIKTLRKWWDSSYCLIVKKVHFEMLLLIDNAAQNQLSTYCLVIIFL